MHAASSVLSERPSEALDQIGSNALREIGKLSVEERRVLIDDLWDSIEAEQALPPIDEAQAGPAR